LLQEGQGLSLVSLVLVTLPSHYDKEWQTRAQSRHTGEQVQAFVPSRIHEGDVVSLCRECLRDVFFDWCDDKTNRATVVSCTHFGDQR
jgi:hypothetical protein